MGLPNPLYASKHNPALSHSPGSLSAYPCIVGSYRSPPNPAHRHRHQIAKSGPQELVTIFARHSFLFDGLLHLHLLYNHFPTFLFLLLNKLFPSISQTEHLEKNWFATPEPPPKLNLGSTKANSTQSFQSNYLQLKPSSGQIHIFISLIPSSTTTKSSF